MGLHAEVHPLGEFGAGDEKRHALAGRKRMRLVWISSMVAGDDKQIARAQLIQECRKPSIELLNGRSGIHRIRTDHVESGKDQPSGTLLNMPLTSSRASLQADATTDLVNPLPPNKSPTFPDADQDLARPIQDIQHRLARRLSGEILPARPESQRPGSSDERMCDEPPHPPGVFQRFSGLLESVDTTPHRSTRCHARPRDRSAARPSRQSALRPRDGVRRTLSEPPLRTRHVRPRPCVRMPLPGLRWPPPNSPFGNVRPSSSETHPAISQ